MDLAMWIKRFFTMVCIIFVLNYAGCDGKGGDSMDELLLWVLLTSTPLAPYGIAAIAPDPATTSPTCSNCFKNSSGSSMANSIKAKKLNRLYLNFSKTRRWNMPIRILYTGHLLRYRPIRILTNCGGYTIRGKQ